MRWVSALAGVVLLLALPAWGGTIQAYNSYLHPPFLDNQGQSGLAPDLVDYLNRRLDRGYRLQLVNLPRARLARLVLDRQETRFGGVALFLTPRFVADEAHTRFLWSLPLSSDYNLLLFRRPAPKTVTSLNSLAGLRFAGVYGHRYQGIDELKDAGLIRREDAAAEAVNLGKVLAGRADFTVMNHSYFAALDGGYAGLFATQTVPHEAAFNRYILIGKHNRELQQALDKVIAQMRIDPEWLAIAHRYELLAPR